MHAAPQTLAEAAAGLDSRDPRERRRAIQDLAEVGSFHAYVLMLSKGLEDREPMVADEAQLLLGRTHEPMIAELVFGRHVLGHRDALVRLRAAEALGRMDAPVAPALWREALKERDPRVQRAFLESLELHSVGMLVRGDIAELVKAVARAAIREKDPSTRGAALITLTHLDVGAGREVVLEHFGKDGGAKGVDGAILRAAALEAWLLLDPDQAIVHAAAVIDDPAPGLRVRAAEVLARAGTKAACEELIGRLEREERARPRAALVAALRGVSGLRHGADPRPWREWLATLPANFFEPVKKEDPASYDDQARTTSFVGHAVQSDRVAFLIDMSGSMWEETNGTTRKARVHAELTKALGALPEGARFNVIPYADTAVPFEKSLVPATPANVAKALEVFERSSLRGKGDVWGALARAYEDAEVDTIVLLTDGAPSGGERWNIELMRQLVRRDNRFRHVAVDVVLFGARAALVKPWREFAAETGGRLSEVEL